MNFDCSNQYPLQIRHYVLLNLTLGLMVLQVFFETPSEHYYCGIKEEKKYHLLYVFVCVSLSQYKFDPPL